MECTRRTLLELWGIAILAIVVGFLGPFGTYLEAEFPMRVWLWSVHLMGAYLLVRPMIWGLSALATATSLPRNALLFWGVVISCFPLALLWQWGASVFFHALGGFTGILPFALLSALAILSVAMGAKELDASLQQRAFSREDHLIEDLGVSALSQSSLDLKDTFRLQARLSTEFSGPVLALQSEDHYVRVHGITKSELLLMRLRDAISEMDGYPGQQVHRGWWVARNAVCEVQSEGRNRTIVLPNGTIVPVARDSISTLERNGFLKAIASDPN